jgi:hypothetical protein
MPCPLPERRKRQSRTSENRSLVRENFPQQENGKSSDLAAEKIGISGSTAERAAHERNRVAVNALPETFVDHAEEIWAMLAEGKTQQAVADELNGNNAESGKKDNWSRESVRNYSALQNICPEAWNIIVTEFQKMVPTDENQPVTKNVTAVTFSERLLRDIVCLTPAQQIELVTDLANGKINKGRFKQLAEAYKVRNKLVEQLKSALSGIDDEDMIRDAVSKDGMVILSYSKLFWVISYPLSLITICTFSVTYLLDSG